MLRSKNIKIELSGVQKTLLMPLWGRAYETEKKEPVISDTYAKEIISKIDYDFSKMESGFSEMERLTWVIRAYQFDHAIKEFITKHDNSLIINIGAGLDTTFQRIDNGKVKWVNIDLPDVISLRKKLMPDEERELSIGKSVFDTSWTDDIREIAKDRAIMIFAAGVFFYFEEEQIKRLFITISETYPKAHLVFDSFPKIVLRTWNKELKKGGKGKLDESAAPMKWYLSRASKLQGWMNTLTVVDDYPLCSGITFKKEWGKKIIFQIRVMNILRLYNMIHVRFG